MSSHQGLRVFIVEDETLVLFNLEDILGELGCVVVGQAMRLEQAEKLAATVERPDCAILDVNLGGKRVFPVAEILVRRGVPVIFATGYGAAGLPEEWRGRPVVLKPYTRDDLVRAIDALPAHHNASLY
ncbi:putative transcriptional regulatory protein pdtaR [Devosia equisanguinis]|uniref:Putative transcriptional regulatory protein pdtaR n=1 Tax=Devosia equisanguinis TaxID=2490941 RepID=A0A3S4DR61_9HYPH|nr:response regulator [Devosia equisanguinis]VDS05376.1 putative transcriptional regulatory protein pdtaR [Devosia equisanguinis]